MPVLKKRSAQQMCGLYVHFSPPRGRKVKQRSINYRDLIKELIKYLADSELRDRHEAIIYEMKLSEWPLLTLLQLTSADVKHLIKLGDVEKLEQVVLEGQGKKLLGEYSSDYRIRTFLKTVPSLITKTSLLHDAVNSGRLEELHSLLEESGDKKKKLVTAKDEAGVGLLHKAVYYELKDIYKYLIEHYPFLVNMKDSEGRTPYHYSTMCRDRKTVQQLLLNAGADPSILDNAQHSAKQYEERKHELELPNPSKTYSNSRKSTAREGMTIKKSNIRIWIHQRDLEHLQQVIWEGHGGKLLVEHSNNPKVRKFLEAVPHIMGLIKDTHCDVQNDDLEALKGRVQPPVPPNVLSAKDSNGLTPLHKAAGLGRQEIAEFIVERLPTSVNAVDSNLRTPLHYAALLKDEGKMFDFLIQAGADESALDSKQKTAAYYKTRPQEIDTKVLQMVPECPRTAKDSFLQNFDWNLLTASTPTEELVKLAKKVENFFGNTTDKDKPAVEKLKNDLDETTHNGKDHGYESEENNNTRRRRKSSISPDKSPRKQSSQDEGSPRKHRSPVKQESEEHDNRESRSPQKQSSQEINDEHNSPRKQISENGRHSRSPRKQASDERADSPKQNGSPERMSPKKQASQDRDRSPQKQISDNEDSPRKSVSPSKGSPHKQPSQERADYENKTPSPNKINHDMMERETESPVRNDSPSKEQGRSSNSPHKIANSPSRLEQERYVGSPSKANGRNSRTATLDKSDSIERQSPMVPQNSLQDAEHGQEGVIEGVVNGENEVEILNEQGRDIEQTEENGADPEITSMVESGNMEQLAGVVLHGDGDKLVGQHSDNSELQSFLDNVPVYMSKIKRIHMAARDGSLKDLQAALDRRKFAIARDKVSPNGASPLHVATIFGNTSIVRYLAGRFPETVQAVDDNGRTPLHYAAVLNDNGHYYNLLLHLGADTRVQDKFGCSPEYYRNHQEKLSHRKLLQKFGAEPSKMEEMLSDKVPNDIYSARKDLDDEEMIKVLDRCFNVLHGRRNSNTISAASNSSTGSNNPQSSTLSKHMKRYIFDSVKLRLTKLDHNLYDLIWPSVKKLPADTNLRNALEQDFPAGVVFPDYYGLDVFHELMAPVVKDIHCMDVNLDLNPHPPTQFFRGDDENEKGRMEIDIDLDPQAKYVITGNTLEPGAQVDMPFFRTEEGRYLASSLGDPLIKGLTEVANKRPEDPIAYLATYLYNFARSNNSNKNNNESRGRTQENAPHVTAGPPQVEDNNQSVPHSIDVVTVEPDENFNEEGAFASTTRDEHGQSMLHFAAARSHGRNALFQLLMETEINVGYRDELYRTARDISIQANVPQNTIEIDRYVIQIATKGDVDKLVELLLDGYDHLIDIVDEDNMSIIEAVSNANQPEAVAFLQSVLAFEEKRERVHHAIRQNLLEEVKRLLADENETGSGKLLAIGKNSYGRCTLHVAVLCQQEEIVDYLAITFPDTLKVGDNLERTALHYAMGVDKMETISKVLIKAGAKRVAKDLKGRQPTYYFMNKSDILRLQEEEETF